MPRIKSLDLARGFIVLLIAPVHTMLLYSNQSVWNSLLGKLFAFIAEWHGAQIFMLIMGISITFKEPQRVRAVAKRSTILFSVAYIFNFLKFDILYFLHALPPGLLDELNISPDDHPYLHLFLTGDILQFAAIAFLITSLIYRYPKYGRIALTMAALLCFFGPFLYDTSLGCPVTDYFLNLFTGQPPQIFFPVFPWIAYPLIGLWIGSLLKKEKPDMGFDSFWLFGVALLFMAGTIKYFIGDRSFSSFYRTTPLDTCIHVSAVFIFLSAWHWTASNVQPNALFKLFSYCSRNITLIYLIQWPLIMALLPLFGFRDLGFLASMMVMALIGMTTLVISLLINLVKHRK